MKKIIDISQFQSNVDYAAAAKEIDGAIIRIGYRGWGATGTLCKDSQFENHVRGMEQNRKPFGFYFFTQAKNKKEAIEEADYACGIIKNHKPVYPIYIDIEESSAPNHTGRADSNTSSEWTDIAVAFCERIKELGYIPGIYMSEYWFNNKIDFDKIKQYSIWCAKVGTNDGTPQIKPSIDTYDGWQYTWVAQVSGFSKGIDMSLFYKDFDTMEVKEDNKVKEKSLSYSTFYVNCKDGLNYRITPNGELKGTLPYKSKAEVINNTETNNNGLVWVQLKNKNWVAKKYLSSKPIVDTYSTYYVNCEDGLNYRAAPNGTRNGTFKNGEKVEIINNTETNNNGLVWVQLKNKNWVAKKYLSETKPKVKKAYEEGKNYKLLYNMKVRVAPNINSKQKLYKDLTADGQRNAFSQFYAVFKVGTIITALEVIENNNEVWIKCPSGYVCAKSGNTTYIK